MRKYLSRLLLGSAMSASAFAFAAEPVSAPLVLSDGQMDAVTAAGKPAPKPPSPQPTSITKTNNQIANLNTLNGNFNTAATVFGNPSNSNNGNNGINATF